MDATSVMFLAVGFPIKQCSCRCDLLTCMAADAVATVAMSMPRSNYGWFGSMLMSISCTLFVQDMHNVENKAVGAPLHKFIGAFRFGLKAALNRASVQGEFGTLAGD